MWRCQRGLLGRVFKQLIFGCTLVSLGIGNCAGTSCTAVSLTRQARTAITWKADL